MANNRMWLLHKPTGKRVLIAKRFGYEWFHASDVAHGLDELFEQTFEDNPRLSDLFKLDMECDDIRGAL